ncbi:MAG: hypothetical protein WCN88_04855 [Candidatus Falkowbacteria bacterium]
MDGINSIKYLSQRDEKWSTDKMGNSNITIGRYGCLLTCISMMSDYFGCYKSPKELATNPHNFDDAGGLQWINLSFPNFGFRWREGSQINVPNEVIDMKMIDSYLTEGKNHSDRAVVLNVANKSHWVLALWKTQDGDYLAIDPWTGKTCSVLETYGNINGASLFIRGSNNHWKGTGKPQSPLYN